MDDDRAFGQNEPTRGSNHPPSTSSRSTSRPASAAVYSSNSTSTSAPLSPTPPVPTSTSKKRATHNIGPSSESASRSQYSTYTDVYSHPAAVAYATAHPRRQIPKFGPYLLLQTLGEGEFGKVKLGLHGEYGEEVAVKLIRRGSVDNTVRFTKIEREIEVLRVSFLPFPPWQFT